MAAQGSGISVPGEQPRRMRTQPLTVVDAGVSFSPLPPPRTYVFPLPSVCTVIYLPFVVQCTAWNAAAVARGGSQLGWTVVQCLSGCTPHPTCVVRDVLPASVSMAKAAQPIINAARYSLSITCVHRAVP